MDIRNDALKKAQEKLAQMRAAGIKPAAPKNAIEKAKADPKSKTKALRAYYWQHHGVVENQGNEAAGALHRDAEADYTEARARSRQLGLPQVIREICFNCEGGHADSGARYRVRDCGARICALHPVRPWKKLKNREPRSEIDPGCPASII